MKFHTLSMSMFVALSMAGCAAGEEEGEQPAAGIEPCEVAGGPCLGDTICGQDSCEPAFDREYQVGVTAVWMSSTKHLELCDRDPGCWFPPNVAVYFSEFENPILTDVTLETPPATIRVPKDSFLVVDLGETTCVIDLSAERLSSGAAGCAGPGSSISLSITAL